MKLKKKLILVVIGLSIFVNVPAFAEDELQLCGIVKKVNPSNMTAVVDVKSIGAKGLHKFKLANNTAKSSFKIGERKCFHIDSSRFKEGYVYTITENQRD